MAQSGGKRGYKFSIFNFSVKSAVKFFESQSTSTPKDTRKRTGRRRRETVAVDWNSFLTAPEEDGTPNSGNQSE